MKRQTGKREGRDGVVSNEKQWTRLVPYSVQTDAHIRLH